MSMKRLYMSKFSAELTAQGRDQIKAKNFVFPEQEKYPIHDLAHARNALARAAQQVEAGNLSEAEHKQVQEKVYAKYPALLERKEEKTASENSMPDGMSLIELMEKVGEEEEDPYLGVGSDEELLYGLLTGELPSDEDEYGYDTPIQEEDEEEEEGIKVSEDVVITAEMINEIVKEAMIPQKKKDIADAIEREHPEYSDEKKHKIAWSAYKKWKGDRG